MQKNFFNYFFLLTIIHIYYIHTEPIFVYEHSRHGARGPSSEYRSLFNNKTFYDEYAIHWDGDGELTVKGKMQHYILGIRNRYKYPNLFNYSNYRYNPEEILVHVTSSRRVKESAYNQLLGMFNPVLKNIDNNNTTLITKISEEKKFYYPPNIEIWKYKTKNKYYKIITEAEMSIKLLEEKNNNMNSFLTEGIFNLSEINKQRGTNITFNSYEKNRTFFKRTCLNHEKYINYNQRKNYQKYIKVMIEKKYGNKLQNFFEYQKKEWLYSIHRSFSIIDHYISNYEEGKNLNYFLNSTNINKDEFYKVCKKVYDYWLFHIFCDKKSCVMESSKLMEDLITYMDKKIHDENNKIKMVLDFGHDVTVGPMQLFMFQAFDVDYTVCSFSCNIFFELHKKLSKDNKERYFVRYFVDDDLRLNIPYAEFKKNVLNNIWTTRQKDEFCRGNIIKVLYPTLFYSLCIGLILIIIFIFICTFNKYYAVYIGKKKEDKNELKNNNNHYGLSDNDTKLLNKLENEIHSGDKNNLRMNSKKRIFEKENNSDAKEMEFI